MKVLHIITGLRNEGAQAVLYRLIVTDRDHTHHVISLMDMDDYGKKLLALGIRVHALNMPCGRLRLHGIVKLFRLIREIKPNVVQTWMYHANLVGGVISVFAGNKTVVWGIHHSDLSPGKLSKRTLLVARICAWFSWFIPTTIICCSDIAATVHTSLGFDSNRITVIHNGINLSEFQPDAQERARIRNFFGICEEVVLLGMVARWDAHKDHATLVAALAQMKLKLPYSWHCMLIGSGMDKSNRDLVCLLDRWGIRDHFILAGQSSDVPSLLNALDLHVLSSSGEAFGNVTVEAMATGVPSVVTSVGAGALIVGETGWVVPPSDPKAMCDAICDAINKMSDRNAWSARKIACRARIIEYFSIDRMVNAYIEVWNIALQKDIH